MNRLLLLIGIGLLIGPCKESSSPYVSPAVDVGLPADFTLSDPVKIDPAPVAEVIEMKLQAKENQSLRSSCGPGGCRPVYRGLFWRFRR